MAKTRSQAKQSGRSQAKQSGRSQAKQSGRSPTPPPADPPRVSRNGVRKSTAPSRGIGMAKRGRGGAARSAAIYREHAAARARARARTLVPVVPRRTSNSSVTYYPDSPTNIQSRSPPGPRYTHSWSPTSPPHTRSPRAGPPPRTPPHPQTREPSLPDYHTPPGWVHPLNYRSPPRSSITSSPSEVPARRPSTSPRSPRADIDPRHPQNRTFTNNNQQPTTPARRPTSTTPTPASRLQQIQQTWAPRQRRTLPLIATSATSVARPSPSPRLFFGLTRAYPPSDPDEMEESPSPSRAGGGRGSARSFAGDVPSEVDGEGGAAQMQEGGDAEGGGGEGWDGVQMGNAAPGDDDSGDGDDDDMDDLPDEQEEDAQQAEIQRLRDEVRELLRTIDAFQRDNFRFQHENHGLRMQNRNQQAEIARLGLALEDAQDDLTTVRQLKCPCLPACQCAVQDDEYDDEDENEEEDADEQMNDGQHHDQPQAQPPPPPPPIGLGLDFGKGLGVYQLGRNPGLRITVQQAADEIRRRRASHERRAQVFDQEDVRVGGEERASEVRALKSAVDLQELLRQSGDERAAARLYRRAQDLQHAQVMGDMRRGGEARARKSSDLRAEDKGLVGKEKVLEAVQNALAQASPVTPPGAQHLWDSDAALREVEESARTLAHARDVIPDPELEQWYARLMGQHARLSRRFVRRARRAAGNGV